jgi:calpain-7
LTNLFIQVNTINYARKFLISSSLALERAEKLKQTVLKSSSSSQIRLPSPPRDEIIQKEEQQPLDIDHANINIIDKRAKLSSHELDVLRRGSIINDRKYVPFFNIDLQERFAFQTPFIDPHGPLKLAPKQQSHFSRWARPDEIMSEPKMIMALSYFAIKQDLISDCSFVASLAVSVQYEKKFNKRLITSIIYPQNKQGEICCVFEINSLFIVFFSIR